MLTYIWTFGVVEHMREFMVTQKAGGELQMFLSVAVTITVAIFSVSLLAHFVGELHALQGVAVGLLCGFILLTSQVAALQRVARKLRETDGREHSKSAVWLWSRRQSAAVV